MSLFSCIVCVAEKMLHRKQHKETTRSIGRVLNLLRRKPYMSRYDKISWYSSCPHEMLQKNQRAIEMARSGEGSDRSSFGARRLSWRGCWKRKRVIGEHVPTWKEHWRGAGTVLPPAAILPHQLSCDRRRQHAMYHAMRFYKKELHSRETTRNNISTCQKHH